jgi:hypothetical protein
MVSPVLSQQALSRHLADYHNLAFRTPRAHRTPLT